VVIVHHFPLSVKHYTQADVCPGRDVSLPDRCPHPECQAEGTLIRWGTYARWACTEEGDYRLRIQRVRCKVCGRTHSLLPDFLHPHRHYVLSLLQQAVSLYLIGGLGFGRLLTQLPEPGPAPSTVREWISAFAYGAGELLLTALTRFLLALAPATELPGPPPPHLDRVSHPTQHHRLACAHHFWLLAEQLYAHIKARQPRLHFSAAQLLPFVLHWLQRQALPPRLFWSPALPNTPTTPF
jgi:hypothetical protein